MMADEMIRVERKFLESTMKAAVELQALEAHGVDNWEGYGDAMRCAHDEGCELCD